MRIIADTREQRAFTFSRFPGVEVEHSALPAGDYSIPGFSDRVAVERKELNDLVNCMKNGQRERFERELSKLQHYEVAAVVCEGSWQDISTHRYRSEMRPQAILQSIMAFMVRYRVNFILAGSREAAEYITHGILSKFAEEVEKRFKVLAKHQEESMLKRAV